MLRKINRVPKKVIDTIFKEGKSLHSPSLILKYVISERTVPRVSFIVPKRVAKLSTRRNKLRRLGYRTLEKRLGEIPRGFLGAFIFKTHEDDNEVLQADIRKLLDKIN